MESELALFLTADVGPANAVLGAGHGTRGRWEHTEDGLAVVRDVLRSVQDRLGIGLTVTWFVRADRLIERQFGERLAIFRRLSGLTDRLVREGHEIGWMPQVYAGPAGEIDYEDLSVTHAALASSVPAPRSVRMGNCFHDNRTMHLLNDLGVRFDSSAMPGREKHDRGWRMDWVGTPEQAYHPSVADYRKPGAPQLDILEVPLAVRPIKAPYDAAPLLRYLNPCMHRGFFWQNLHELIASSSYLLCILHPDEALPCQGERGHPLVAYSKDELEFNLRELIGVSGRMGRAVTFRKLETFVAPS